MAKKRKRKKITCKKCGESWLPNELPTNKEWSKAAPMPDSEGRITITLMATWTCPGCGKSVMGAKGKYKDEETGGPSKKERLLEKINEADEKITIAELASALSLNEKNVEKALLALIKRKEVSGKIEKGFFIKE